MAALVSSLQDTESFVTRHSASESCSDEIWIALERPCCHYTEESCACTTPVSYPRLSSSAMHTSSSYSEILRSIYDRAWSIAMLCGVARQPGLWSHWKTCSWKSQEPYIREHLPDFRTQLARSRQTLPRDRPEPGQWPCTQILWDRPYDWHQENIRTFLCTLAGMRHHLRKSADRKAQIKKAFVPDPLTGLMICAFRYADFFRQCLYIPRPQPHAQSLFLFQ